MTLYEKIIFVYPELVVTDVRNDFFANGLILLQNDSDGRGDYIAKWEHPTLPRPTDEQLGE